MSVRTAKDGATPVHNRAIGAEREMAMGRDNIKTEAEIVAEDALSLGRTADAIRILLDDGKTLAQALHATAARTLPTVGDVLVSSWGYDQTNIDYYQVVGVTKASVKLRKIGKRRAGGSRGSDLVVPDPGRFANDEKPLTRRFNVDSTNSGDYRYYRYWCRIEDYAYAYLWEGESNYETAAGYGH